MNEPIRYFDRQAGAWKTETVMGDAVIRWAYASRSGRCLAPAIFGNRLLSRVLGAYFNSRASQSRIAATIADLDIDPSEFRDAVSSFPCFNAFFTRHLKPEARPFSAKPSDLLSPADGRLLVYPRLDGADAIRVKGIDTTLDDLFGQSATAFHGGDVVVVRLCPADYHRYHFPCAGRITGTRRMSGAVHSVNPLALAAVPQVFVRNKRSITLLETDDFGTIAYLEVGAFGVAAIHDTYTGTTVERMQEKGYFAFGGSTVVMVLQPGRVNLSPDLVEHSANGHETLVRVGETIGAQPGSC